MAERDNDRRDELIAVGIGHMPGAVRPDGSPAGTGIIVYGAWWCGDTRRSVALLDRLNIAHTYVSVDEDAAANVWAAAQNNGQRRIPVVVLGAGGPTLIEPSDEALLAALSGVESRESSVERRVLSAETPFSRLSTLDFKRGPAT